MSNRNGLGDYDHRFLDCRDIGHQWTPQVRAIVEGSKIVGYERTLRCRKWKKCVQRVDVYDLQGRLVRRSYRYPDGYVMKGQGRTSRQNIRVLNLKRHAGRR